MKKIFFATGNASKVNRFKEGLLNNDIEIMSIKDIDKDIDIEENGKTAIENALIKARAYSKVVDMPVLAMDDSLYIEGVPDDKQPGLYVRRVNGKRLNDEEMIEHYTSLVKEYGINGKINCKWIYGMALIDGDKEATYTWSLDDFFMVEKVSPNANKDYPLNSISIDKTLNKYFSEITPEEKEMIKRDESDVIEFIVKNF